MARDLTHDPAVGWLLNTGDASVRYFTYTDVLGKTRRTPVVREAESQIPNTPWIRALLQTPFDGHDAVTSLHPYKKWQGVHWRLVSLVELGITQLHPRARAMLEPVLSWLTHPSHAAEIPTIRGRTRVHASQEGNALAVASRLGLAADERVQTLARSLIAWQWPDGGWNCDRRSAGEHSSFYESVSPLWGLIEYRDATRDRDASLAVERGCEMFLRHRLFKSCSRGDDVIRTEWLKLHYPVYWHYDVLQALVIMSRAGVIDDPRCRDALDHIASKRLANGTWRSGGRFWRNADGQTSHADVVDWGRSGPNLMITLNALRVLAASNRL